MVRRAPEPPPLPTQHPEPSLYLVHCPKCDARFTIARTVAMLDEEGKWSAFCPGCYAEIKL